MSFSKATSALGAHTAAAQPMTVNMGRMGRLCKTVPFTRRAPLEKKRKRFLVYWRRITVSFTKRKDGFPTAMNASSEMSFEDMLRVRLEVLRREHRDLDEAIYVLETASRPDPMTLRRLKKQKLALKDHIVKLEDQLIPNIIA
jgi:hypothetical protein